MIKKVDILGGRDREFGIDMNTMLYFILFFSFYIIVLVLPYMDMNSPWMYMCSPFLLC